MTSDTKTCSGHCCKAFQLGGQSYEQLKLEYERWLRGEKTPSAMRGAAYEPSLGLGFDKGRSPSPDIHVVFPMLIPLGRKKRNPMKLVNREWMDSMVERHEQREGREEWEGVEFFSCKHLVDDRCSIYDVRPTMCRSYGLGQTCEFEDCTWEGHKELKRELVQIGKSKLYMEENTEMKSLSKG